MVPIQLERRFEVIGTPPPDIDQLRTFSFVFTSICFAISSITLVLRFLARSKSGQPLRVDDWLVVAGYLISLLAIVGIFIQLANGLGYHMTNLTTASQVMIFKGNFVLQRANQPAMACIKISILAFYMRIFTVAKFKYLVWANIIYTLLWAIIGWIVNILVCKPIQFFWDKTIVGGTCGSQQLSGALNGSFGAVGDVIILCLPVYMVWQLQLDQRRKIAISMIFLLGAFVCFASIYRIIVVSQAPPADFTYAQIKPSTWTAIEMQAAIISANLPCLAPLFQALFKKAGFTRKYSANPDGSTAAIKTIGQQRSNGTGSGFGKKDNPLNTTGFERLDDSDSGSKKDYGANIELDDTKNILVKTEIRATTRYSISNSEADEMQSQTVNAWMHR
ncbi:hypothetical protein BX600DRAFT_516887 [Xylariales sp. PMI_506]|nr:hypothetical protein BX600DRAFT_516887 [Xylariales sp. PMI_506]